MLLDRWIDGAILVCGAVVIAECDQRPNLKTQVLWPFWVIILLQFVLHDRTVLAVDHEDGLLDLNALDFVDEGRKWIETELLQVSKTLRMYRAGIAVRREIKRLPIDEQRFLQLGEQDEAFHGGPESSD